MPPPDKIVGMAGRKKGGCFIQERQRKKRRGSEEIDVGYVPVCLHEHLQYDRKGQRSLSDITKKVFRFVKSNFEIPSDIERSKEVGTTQGRQVFKLTAAIVWYFEWTVL